jgi:hypothetical protein
MTLSSRGSASLRTLRLPAAAASRFRSRTYTFATTLPWLILLSTAGGHGSVIAGQARNGTAAKDLPRTVSLSAFELEDAKARLAAGDASLAPALKRLRAEAHQLLGGDSQHHGRPGRCGREVSADTPGVNATSASSVATQAAFMPGLREHRRSSSAWP